MKAARAGNAAVSALGWLYAAAVVTAGTTTKMLPFSCPLRRSLRCGWQCAHPRDSPEPEPRARAPSPRMCRVTFAAQGIFPFLPKDGTRIHRNRTTRHPGYVRICAKFQQVPPGQCPSLTSITLWSILPWADPGWTQGDGQQQQRENGVIACSECAAGGDVFP